jgi:hypothetical protein
VNEETSIFSIQDHLRLPDRLEQAADGKLVFLDENQGNWSCATLPEGDDPPVWVEDVFDVYQQGRWGLVTDSLSKFLVTFCLQELLFGSRLCLSDDNLSRLFDSSADDVIPLWLNGSYAQWSRGFSFYLFHGSVLVGQLHGGIWFGADAEDGVRFLTAHQGAIRAVELGLHSSWSLSIEADGSAELTYPNWEDSSATIPAGTFDFGAVRDELLAACSGSRVPRAWYVCFPRWGQTSSQGVGVKDTRLARRIFRRALQAVVSNEAQFEELLRKFPPPL